MRKIKIVVDSSADLTELPGVDFESVPLKIVTDNREYVDNEELDVTEMVNAMYRYSGKSSTACPSIGDWLLAFGEAEEIFCLTITSNLSGSYNAARMAKAQYEEAHPDRRVCLIDSLSAGPEIALMAEKIRDMIAEGLSFEEISERFASYKTELLFVLESMKNLANNGRVSRLAAAAAGILGIRAVGKASEQGTLEMLTKCRGAVKTIETLVKYMIEHGYKGAKARISHCMNLTAAKELAAKIIGLFPKARVTIGECRGLCSFYAERGGLLLGYEV